MQSGMQVKLTCALQRESSFGLAQLFLLDIMRIHLLTSQEQEKHRKKHGGHIPRHV